MYEGEIKKLEFFKDKDSSTKTDTTHPPKRV